MASRMEETLLHVIVDGLRGRDKGLGPQFNVVGVVRTEPSISGESTVVLRRCGRFIPCV